MNTNQPEWAKANRTLPEPIYQKAKEYFEVAKEMAIEQGVDEDQAEDMADFERVAFIAGAHAYRLYLDSNHKDQE